jgi:hypothetical protein
MDTPFEEVGVAAVVIAVVAAGVGADDTTEPRNEMPLAYFSCVVDPVLLVVVVAVLFDCPGPTAYEELASTRDELQVSIMALSGVGRT